MAAQPMPRRTRVRIAVLFFSFPAVLASCGSVTAPAPSPDASACGASLVDLELLCEFGEGTFTDTEWAGDRIQLVPGRSSGSFTSRVFDRGTDTFGWAALGWSQHAPYAKPLPDGAAVERGYPEGDVDMTGNVLLLHLDEAELGDGRLVMDSSGRENHAEMVTAGEILRAVPGRFGGAVADSASTYLHVDLAKAPDLDFGTDDFTWALWVQSTEDCTGNKVYMGVEDEGSDRAHLWLGCGDATNSGCPDGPDGGRAAGTFRSVHDAPGDGGAFCSVSRINDGAWHHLALVKEEHPDSRLSLYVDGTIEFQTGASFVGPLSFQDAPEFAVGAFSQGTYQAAGRFDEVAVWRRALDPAEIEAVYRRGALRLSFQVRTCDDAGCNGASRFVGPGADEDAFFVEPALFIEPGGTVSIRDVAPGRYLQYRAYFQSDIANQSPRLGRIELWPEITPLP